MISARDLGARPSPGGRFLARKRRRVSDRVDRDRAVTHVGTGSCYDALRSLGKNQQSPEPRYPTPAPESGEGEGIEELGGATTWQTSEQAARPVEELTWQGASLVWTLGAHVHRSFDFEEGDQKVVQAIFARFHPPSMSSAGNATSRKGSAGPSGASNSQEPHFWSESHAPSKRTRPSDTLASIRALCVFLRDHAYFFYESGDEYIVHFPWTLRRAWALEQGLICETTSLRSAADECSPSQPQASLWTITDPSTYHFRPVKVARKASLPCPFDNLVSSDGPGPAEIDGLRNPAGLYGTAHAPFAPVRADTSILFCADPATDPSFPVLLTADPASIDILFSIYIRLGPTGALAPLTHESAPDPGTVSAPVSPSSALRRSTRVQRKRSSLAQVSGQSAGMERGPSAAALQSDNDSVLAQAAGLVRLNGAEEELGRVLRKAGAANMSRRVSNRGVVAEPVLARDKRLGISPRASLAQLQVERDVVHSELDDTFAPDDAAEHAMLIEEAFLPDIVTQTVKVFQVPDGTGHHQRDQTDIAMYNDRGISANLALCLPKAATVYLFSLERTPDSIQVSSLRALDALGIASVACTRSRLLDLAILRNTGDVVMSPGESAPEMKVGKSLGKVVGLSSYAHGVLCVSTQTKSRSPPATRLWSISAWPRDALTQAALEALAGAIDERTFGLLHAAYVEQRHSMAGASQDLELAALATVLEHALDLGGGASPTGGAGVQASQNSTVLIDNGDPALRWISPANQADCIDPPLSLPPKPKRRIPSTLRFDSPTSKAALDALGWLWADYQCRLADSIDRDRLGGTLLLLASKFGLADWRDQLSRALGACPASLESPRKLGDDAQPQLPDVVDSCARLMSSRPAVSQSFQEDPPAPSFFGAADPVRRSRQLFSLLRRLFDRTQDATGVARAEAALKELLSLGWTEGALRDLPIALSIPWREALRCCQLEAPEDLTAAGYRLIGREDLARQRFHEKAEGSAALSNAVRDGLHTFLRQLCFSDGALNTRSTSRRPDFDASRFSDDMRTVEVARMLNHTKEVRLRLAESSDSSPQAQASEHAGLIALYARRTMALPYGAACFAFRTVAGHSVVVPSIKLSVRSEPQGTILQADATKVESLAWPKFHAGVAAALSLSDGRIIDGAHLSLDRPDDLDDRHAGYLLGLGLNDRLRSITRMQVFRYLDSKHEMTSIAVLLGLAAAFRGTSDPKVSSILAAHVSAMYPSQSSHLNVSPLAECAGVVAFGLLHMETRHRRISDTMLHQLANTTRVSTDSPDHCREAYALSTAMSYGLIMLGSGSNSSDPSRASSLRTFKHLIHGDATRPLPGVNEQHGTTDTTLTSPAATVALAMQFLRTNSIEAASLCELPSARRRLDFITPNLLMLRALARCLIMWDKIEPSLSWIESPVPKFIARPLDSAASKSDATVDTAYWNVVTGSAFALALKYAGSARAEAHGVLIALYDRASKAGSAPALTVQAKIRRHSIRTCANMLLLSLALVMAGTGELQVLRRLRVAHGSISENVSHGSHVATHLALGLLFLGAGQYTLGTSNAAVGALICACYPLFPGASDDHAHHLQPLRHFWALAVEPRCLVARDVDRGGKPVFLPLKLKIRERGLADPGARLRSKALIAPTLTPPADHLSSVKVESPRYWPSTAKLDGDPRLTSGHVLWVKRKTGHLDYAEDPRGIRSIATRGRSTEGATTSRISEYGRLTRSVKEAMFGGKRTGFKQLADLAHNFDLAAGPSGLVHLIASSGPRPARRRKALDFAAFVSATLVQCLLQDKMPILPLYFQLFEATSTPLSPSTLSAQRQILLLARCYPGPMYGDVQNVVRSPLLDAEALAHAEVQLRQDSEAWFSAEAQPVFEAYMRQGVWPNDASTQLAQWLSLHLVPGPGALQALRSLIKRASAQPTEADGTRLASAIDLVVCRIIGRSDPLVLKTLMGIEEGG